MIMGSIHLLRNKRKNRLLANTSSSLLSLNTTTTSTMSSIVQTFQRRQSLPVSSNEQGLRRRLSSLSLRIQPNTASWAFHRSNSVSSMADYAGTSIRKCWHWGCSWLLSKKPTFAQDLEMNEEETRVLGCQNKGSWRHVFYKVRSELRKLIRSDKVGLPQTCNYTSFDYSKNFEG